MQWLTQNWLWIVLIIGIFMFMHRAGIRRGVAHGHSHDSDVHALRQPEIADRHDDANVLPKDPVSGEAVNTETALNTMYQGRVYYFASRENRGAFEASPARYGARVGERDEEHRHHRHGC